MRAAAISVSADSESVFAVYGKNIALFGGVFLVYLGVNLFASYMYHVAGTAPAVLIAPQGIALAAALILGYAAIPITSLATFIVALYSGNPLPLALLATAANFIQPAVTLYVLDRFKISRELDSAWDFYRYIATAFVTCTIVPTINVLGREFYNINATESVATLIWSNLWVAGLVSTLILTPLIVRFVRPLRGYTKAELIENIGAVLVLNIPTAILTFTPTTTFLGVNLIIPFCFALLWVALRGGTFFVTLAMFTVTVSALSGRILGHPANPEHLDLPAQIVAAEISLIFFSLIFYFIAALEESRRDATMKLRAYSQGLEKTVSEKELDSEAKNEFISMLGHEIRNPLASLLSSVELLKLGGPDVDIEKTVNSMSERINSIRRLLDDMFDISRITRKKLNLKKELIPARTVLRRAADAVDHRISENHLRFTVTLPDKNVLIEADPVRIEQIVSNLLYNATKYTPAGGSIDFTSEYHGGAGGGELAIHVKDTGIGLSGEEQGRIFEPYMQINPSQSLMGGIGLGLTLARNLVEMHNGRIEVKSAGRGRGSEFIVRIPARLSSGEKSPARQPEDSEKKGDTGAYKILVVDDNVNAANALSKLLKLYGYEVAAVYNGSDVLEKSREMRPNAIVLDIGLPDIDGFEVAQALRSDENSSVLIALSGYGQEMHRQRAREVGFNHFLTKPASVQEIIEIVAVNGEAPHPVR